MDENSAPATEVGDNFVLIVCLIISVIFWGKWYWQSFQIRPLGARGSSRRWLQAAPLACGTILYVVLRHLAATDVRNAPYYLFLYMLMGCAWLAILQNLAIYFGLSHGTMYSNETIRPQLSLSGDGCSEATWRLPGPTSAKGP